MLGMVISCHSFAQDAAQSPVFETPLRIVSMFPTGTGPDVVVRLLAEKLQQKWQRPVVVDARPGASGVLAINATKSLPPERIDLVLADSGSLVVNPLIFKNLSYDPQKDLVPVSALYKGVFFVTVGAAGPYKTMKDLTDAAKQKSLSFASNGIGSPQHLYSEQLVHGLRADMLHVPFKEGSQLYAAISSGEVDWVLSTLGGAGPLLRSGKLRFLSVMDKERVTAAADIPTLEEAGGPAELYSNAWVALMAPAGLPDGMIEVINREVNEALQHSDIKERLAILGFEPTPGSPKQVETLMREARRTYQQVVERLHITAD